MTHGVAPLTKSPPAYVTGERFRRQVRSRVPYHLLFRRVVLAADVTDERSLLVRVRD